MVFIYHCIFIRFRNIDIILNIERNDYKMRINNDILADIESSFGRLKTSSGDVSAIR